MRISMHLASLALAALLSAIVLHAQPRTSPAYDPGELLKQILYPYDALHGGRSGKVKIEVLVGDDGKPAKTFVASTTGEEFSAPVRHGVMQITYTPASKNGRPYVDWVEINISFEPKKGGNNEKKGEIAIMNAKGKRLAARMVGPGGVGVEENAGRVTIRPMIIKPEQKPSEIRERDAFAPSVAPPSSLSSPSDTIPHSREHQPEYDDAELQARVRYPVEAKDLGVEGIVKVQVFVDEYGRATKATISQGLHPLLDDAARSAVLETQFVPVFRDGKRSAAWVEVPIKFRLPR